MAPAPLSAGLHSLPLLPTIKLGPSGADSQVGGWACACFQPLWVSPMNSSVRLGVSPAAASTPMGVFNQRLEALFPHAGALGCSVCFAPPQFLRVYLCANVGPRCLLATAWPARFVPQSAKSLVWLRCCKSSLPSCLSPPLLPVWINVSSLAPWLSDFHTVHFSVSSGWFLFLNCCCPSFGCVRRCSVSTYASFLAGSP